MLWARPCHPPLIAETTIPASRNGNTSQFGIRRLRRSDIVAVVMAKTVGHQAIECIKSLLAGAYRTGRGASRAIRNPFQIVGRDLAKSAHYRGANFAAVNVRIHEVAARYAAYTNRDPVRTA